MQFVQPLLPGILRQRYKRFLADVELADGTVITVHCANPGSMKSCAEPGWPVQLWDSQNPQRKLRYTLEMLYNGVSWIGVNTHRANELAEEGIRSGMIQELQGYTTLKREVKYGQNSRIDIWLQQDNKQCYVEVKNVTLLEDGCYQFPDARTERGRKHLYELLEMVKAGHRAVMLFVIQRQDGQGFKPAWHIDPAYAASLAEVQPQGVEILCYEADVSPAAITLKRKVDVVL